MKNFLFVVLLLVLSSNSFSSNESLNESLRVEELSAYDKKGVISVQKDPGLVQVLCNGVSLDVPTKVIHHGSYKNYPVKVNRVSVNNQIKYELFREEQFLASCDSVIMM